jgi:DNA-directed RNA polymerase subunit L
MSTVASLQVKIGAEVQAAINGMSKAQFAADKVATAFESASQQSQVMGSVVSAVGSRVAQAASNAQSVVNRIDFSKMGAGAEDTFNKVQKVIDGTVNLGNAATLVSEGFVRAQQISGVAISAIAAAAPRIGVALAAAAGPIGLVIGAVGALVGSFIAFNTAQDNTINLQAELNNKINEEVSQMGAYIAVLGSTNLTFEKRGELIDTVNDKYDTTLKNLKDETAFAAQLDKAYQDLALSIKNKILIEASQSSITKLVGDIIQLESVLKGFEAGAQADIDKLIVGGGTPGQIDAVTKRLEAQTKTIKSSLAELNAELTKETTEIGNLFNDTLSKPGKTDGAKKSVDEVAEAYRLLDETLAGIQTKLSQTLISPLEAGDLQIDTFVSTINKLIAIDPSGSAAQAAIDRYKDLFDRTKIVLPSIAEVAINPVLENTGQGDAAKKALQDINNAFAKNPPKIRINVDETTFADQVKSLSEKINSIVQPISDIGNRILDIVNLSGNFEGRFEQLESYYERESELIENSIASESVKAGRQKQLDDEVAKKKKAILREQAIAQKASALFNAIINTAQGVSAALATANIPLAAIVGALGGIEIGLIAGTPIPALASGALVSGPNTVLVGEYPGAASNPELISPVDKVQKYIIDAVQDAGGSQSDSLVASVSGDDLLFLLTRAQRKKSRTT